MDPFRRFNPRDKPSTDEEKLASRTHRREKRDAGAGGPRFQRSPASPGAPARDARLAPLDAGRPLDETTRARMEASYGRDLRDVRIHTDSSAAQSAASLDAQAFTTGRDVVFGAGGYAPETTAGTRLLAHEIAHVVQQASGAVAPAASGDQLSIGSASDRLEQGAEHAAAQVVDGPRAAGAADLSRSTTVAPAAGAPAIQRQELPAVPEVTLRPSPFLARSIGSATLDGFAVDSAALTGEHQGQLAALAPAITTLLRSYPGGSLSAVGHTRDRRRGPQHGAGRRRADAVKAAPWPPVCRRDRRHSSAGESAPAVPSEQAGHNRRGGRFRAGVSSSRRNSGSRRPLQGPAVEDAPPTAAPPAAGVAIGPGQLLPLRLPPSYYEPHEETPAETGRRIFAPIPPAPASGGTSLTAVVLERVDRALNSAMRRLGIDDERIQGVIRDAVHAGVGKAASGALEAALDQTPLTPEQKKMIEASVEAAVKTPAL
jgi:outer membrane protein OmpA-like peptidoglycan-associated protein